jgi:hypothetical protein
MPGFVDVSGMTYEDVRRMGHADDYDEPFVRNPYAYRKPVASTPRVRKLELNTDDVFAAACAAQRLNGQYVKAIAPGTTQKTNRQIAEELLKDPTQIALDDRQQGERVRQYFKGFTFKVIEGKQLSDFAKNAMDIAGNDIITSTYQLAVVVSLPASYEKSAKRDDVDRRINFARGGFVGSIGDKVTLNIEVLKQLWSEKFNTWYITGITGEDQVVFFAHRTQYDIGTMLTVQGVVKSQRDVSTQLGRVKVL